MKEFDKNSGIDDMIKISIDRIRELMETSTIIGDSVKINEHTSIIPISKVSMGFVVGGGEYSDKSTRRVANHYPMAGGSGCGMSVNPVGFLVINSGDVQFVDIENKDIYQTILNLVNKIINKSFDGGKNENKKSD